MLNVVRQVEINVFCDRPFNRMKVTPEGDVSVCCFQTNNNTIGNLLQDSFEEVWFGSKAKSIRNVTADGRLHQTCMKETCPFTTITPLNLNSFQVAYDKYPSFIEFDLPTQHCNIGGENPSPETPACLMCERSTYFVKQEDRLDEVCEVVKPYVKHLNHVHVQGVSEPFWKNRIFEVLDNLDLYSYRNQLCLSSTTNATILTQDKREKYLQYPSSYLTFSLDASTPETYRIVRVWDYYDKVIANLMAYSNERTNDSQKIIIHNNINLININDVVGMVEVAADCGANTLEFNPTYAVETICVNESNAKLFKLAEDKIKEASERLGVNTVFIRPLDLDLCKKIHQIKL